MKSLFLVTLLAAVILPVIHAERTSESDASTTDLPERTELFSVTIDEIKENGSTTIDIKTIVSNPNLNAFLVWILGFLGSIDSFKKLKKVLPHPNFDLFCDVVKLCTAIMLVLMCAIAMCKYGYDRFIERKFNRWNSVEKDAFIRKWPGVFSLLYKIPNIRIPEFYTEVQRNHQANCFLCDGRLDAFRCRSRTVNTWNIPDDMDGEIFVVPPPIVKISEEEGINSAAAKKLGMPHLS